MSETKLMALREAVNLAMSEEMRKDENIFLMGEDVGIYGGDFGTSVGMLAEFGEKRVRDTPISEAAIAGAAVGPSVLEHNSLWRYLLRCRDAEDRSLWYTD